MKKMISAWIAVMCFMLLLSACSQQSSAPAGSGENSLEKIKEKGVIRVGGTTTGPPFSFLNKQNENVGLMYDFANTVAEGLGVKVEIQGMLWSALIPAIEGDKIDMISAGMLITDERKKVLDFSDPVYSYGEGLVVLKDDTTIKSFEDLKGKKVGVSPGGVYAEALKAFPEIQTQTYKSTGDMISELENGRIDAFYQDYPIVLQLIKDNPQFEIKLVEGYESKWVGDVGLAFPKGSDSLVKAVNEQIKKLKDSGEIDAIIKKWGL